VKGECRFYEKEQFYIREDEGEVWSVEYGVWSMEYGVWSMEYKGGKQNSLNKKSSSHFCEELFH